MNISIKIMLKISMAAATVFMVGFFFLVLSPAREELVQPAEADIYSFTGIDEENNFKRAMESVGIKARAYDFNGNIMYFGTSRIHGSRSAEETAGKVQDQLVIAGVNSKNYMSRDPHKHLDLRDSLSEKEVQSAQEHRAQMVTGEVAPISKGKTSIKMSGVTGIGSMKQLQEKIASLSLGEAKRGELSDYINGYRYIEVNQPEGSTTAEIIAIWTDDKFDADKMTNKEGVAQSEPDPNLPACIGCKRVRRVQALDKEEPYNINKWESTSSMNETYNFYVQAMGRRGWKESGRQKTLNKFAEHLPSVRSIRGMGLSLEKGGRVIDITILPTKSGGSEVFSLEKYNEIQPTLNIQSDPNSKTSDSIARLFGL